MIITEICAVGGLLIGLVGLLTTYFLQRDVKQMQELRRENRKYRNRLTKALLAIQGYQDFEAECAQRTSTELVEFRKQVREKRRHWFESPRFIEPAQVDTQLNELREEGQKD